jgi:hypothetical protein
VKHLPAAIVLAAIACSVCNADYLDQFQYTITPGNCTGKPVTVTLNDSYTNVPVRGEVKFQLYLAGGMLQDLMDNWTSSETGAITFVPPVAGRYHIAISRPGYIPVDLDVSYYDCPECANDYDCPDAARCTAAGKCVNVTGVCGYASDHVWNRYECCENADCGDKQACIGYSCVNLTGTCGRAENHAWYPFECCSDSDCGPRQACVNNSCAQSLGCETDLDCLGTEACRNSVCVRVVGDCGYASGHTWVRYECCSDSQCATGVCMDDHTCAPQPRESPSVPASQGSEGLCAPALVLPCFALLALFAGLGVRK